ncbi:MAG TPA: hypothetical protein VIF15_19010 [Polyangiaceae bacterium]|jgi:hypothetical protein
MNPYAAPGTLPARGAEDDIADATPPLLARVAGGVVALAGAVVALTGAQTLLFVTIRGPAAMAPYVLVALGVPEIVLGTLIFRARAWAALIAIGGTILSSLASAAWLVFSVGHYLFSLYALMAPVFAVSSLVFAILALGPCQRASAARARLRAQGLNLGI